MAALLNLKKVERDGAALIHSAGDHSPFNLAAGAENHNVGIRSRRKNASAFFPNHCGRVGAS
jgi:hypothetical protein